MSIETREKENLQNYKKIIRGLLSLLRNSLQVDTVSMFWINNKRGLLVLENYVTSLKDVVFEDRIRQQDHFLGEYSTIKSVVRLQRDIQLSDGMSAARSSRPSVRTYYLIPFVYRSETVALTCVETSDSSSLSDAQETLISTYQDIQSRILSTYLELSDLLEKQLEWSDYEILIRETMRAATPLELAAEVVEKLQDISGAKNGGVVLLARGMGHWHTVLCSAKSVEPPAVGLLMQEGSLADQVLKTGEPEFTSHFNANPKRISQHEPLSRGATLAIPVLHRQRRQLLFLVYNENPLLFTESLKHKMTNLCRMAGLRIEGMLPSLQIESDIFSVSSTCYDKELYRISLNKIIQNLGHCSTEMSTWAVMLCLGNISDLRTKYRLEDLKEIQKQVVMKIRPQNFGISGIIADYSDYVYSILLQSPDEYALKRWGAAMKEAFNEPVVLPDAQNETIKLHFGFTEVASDATFDRVIQQTKHAMNQAVRNNVFSEQT